MNDIQNYLLNRLKLRPYKMFHYLFNNEEYYYFDEAFNLYCNDEPANNIIKLIIKNPESIIYLKDQEIRYRLITESVSVAHKPIKPWMIDMKDLHKEQDLMDDMVIKVVDLNTNQFEEYYANSNKLFYKMFEKDYVCYDE